MKRSYLILLALVCCWGCSADFIGMHIRLATEQKAADFQVTNQPTTQAVHLGSLDSTIDDAAVRAIGEGVVQGLLKAGMLKP